MNPVIEKSRTIGLDVLKPAKKDIDKGLGLHKELIIFDSYGFSPTSGRDSNRIAEQKKAGASALELKDMGEEMSMMDHIRNENLREKYAEVWNEAGVTCVFQNAGEEGNEIDRLIKRFGRFTHVVDSLPDILKRCAFPADIEATKKEGKHCLYMTCNGVPLAGRHDTVEEELAYIRTFFQLGCRMMHLTYNRRNMLGDGCGEPADGGLSDLGREAIKEMNRVGVIVDVAHSGLRTSLEAAEASSKPMVASHSACAALRTHCRNKTDEVIKAIIDTGGYVGISCIPSFLGGSGDINALLDHIDYMAKHFGTDHVAIGTDKVFSLRPYKPEASSSARKEFRTLWPENSFPEEFKQERQVESLAWTNWPLFTTGLVKRGYSEADIAKIVGGNVMRVARAVLK